MGGFLACLVLAFALAACAGIRAWLPLFLAGSLTRVGLFQLGSSYHFLSSNKALVLFGLASLVEIAADKVPGLDHALDIVSSIFRPAAGALLAAAVFGRLTDPVVSLALGIAVGAPTAFAPHLAKAGLRAASTLTTAGLGNPVLSFVEDFSSLALFAIAILAPVVAILLFIGVLALLRRRRTPQGAEVA